MTLCEACQVVKTRNDFPRRRSPTKMRRCKACVKAKYFGSVKCADCGECKEMALYFHQNQRKVPKGTWKCKVCVATQWQRAHYGSVLPKGKTSVSSSIGAKTNQPILPPSPPTSSNNSWKPLQQLETPAPVPKQPDAVLSEVKIGFTKISLSPRSVEEELFAVCMPTYRETYFQEETLGASDHVSIPLSPRSMMEELRDKVHVSIDENGLVSVSLDKRY